jgi:hypothetical protein
MRQVCAKRGAREPQHGSEKELSTKSLLRLRKVTGLRTGDPIWPTPVRVTESGTT